MSGQGLDGQGTTTIEEGGNLTIMGSVTLTQRTLVIQGQAQWVNQTELHNLSITMDRSSIIIDGGSSLFRRMEPPKSKILLTRLREEVLLSRTMEYSEKITWKAMLQISM